jgi:hypothetical protein
MSQGISRKQPGDLEPGCHEPIPAEPLERVTGSFRVGNADGINAKYGNFFTARTAIVMPALPLEPSERSG